MEKINIIKEVFNKYYHEPKLYNKGVDIYTKYKNLIRWIVLTPGVIGTTLFIIGLDKLTTPFIFTFAILFIVPIWMLGISKALFLISVNKILKHLKKKGIEYKDYDSFIFDMKSHNLIK